MGLIIKIAIEKGNSVSLTLKRTTKDQRLTTYYWMNTNLYIRAIQNIELEKETKKKRTDNCPL